MNQLPCFAGGFIISVCLVLMRYWVNRQSPQQSDLALMYFTRCMLKMNFTTVQQIKSNQVKWWPMTKK